MDIKTPDGNCDSYISFPDGKKNLPIVVMLMDAIGLRPRIYEIADQLASEGYYVIAPNLFYRDRRAPVVDYDSLLGNLPELLKQVMVFAGHLTPELSKIDMGAWLKFVKDQSQPLVSQNQGGGFFRACRSRSAHAARAN